MLSFGGGFGSAKRRLLLTATGPGISIALSSCKPFSFPQTCLTLATRPRQPEELQRAGGLRAVGVIPQQGWRRTQSGKVWRNHGRSKPWWGGASEASSRGLRTAPVGTGGSLGLLGTRCLGRKERADPIWAAYGLQVFH